MAGSVWGKCVAAAVLGFAMFSAAVASADTRSVKLMNMHTGEKAEIVFKRDGRYDSAGLRKVNHILRDWRRNEPRPLRSLEVGDARRELRRLDEEVIGLRQFLGLRDGAVG